MRTAKPDGSLLCSAQRSAQHSRQRAGQQHRSTVHDLIRVGDLEGNRLARSERRELSPLARQQRAQRKIPSRGAANAVGRLSDIGHAAADVLEEPCRLLERVASRRLEDPAQRLPEQ